MSVVQPSHAAYEQTADTRTRVMDRIEAEAAFLMPGMCSGSAPMGGRTPAKDLRGDGMINEADRGGAHDY